MKTKFTLLLVTVIASTAFNWQRATAQANTTLSNLTSPTAINQSLLPNTNNTLNLGTAVKSWSTLYLDSSIYLKDSLFIHNRGTQNAFLGQRAGYAITTGRNNTASGYHALYSSKTSSNNSAFGSLALSNTTTGFSNSAFGYSALNLNTTGVANTAVGSSALGRNTTGKSNSALGHQALSSNTTGFENTASGYYALYSNTTGGENTAHGVQALYANTTGNENTATGYDALYANTTGTDNTANGFGALISNTTGNYNTGNGAYALFSNTTGNKNTANGTYALYANTSGNNNTATGYQALYANISGVENTAGGYLALSANTNGNYNTANGWGALKSNLSGEGNTANGYGTLYFNTTGLENTANGDEALYNNTTGDYNTATGNVALYHNATGDYNTANGYESLYSNTEGVSNTAYGLRTLYSNVKSFNTAIGSAALYANTTGDHNTAIGVSADVAGNSLQNATVIGADAIVNASNKVRIGDANVTVVESAAGSWTTSDGRFKNNIKENVKGLEFIKLLKPVTYDFDTRKFSEFLLQNYPDSIKKERLAAIDTKGAKKVSDIIQSGFIAQDVAAAVKKSGYNFSGVHAPENPTDNWSLSYEKLVVPLVKAVQELDEKNTALENENKKQDEEIAELKQMVQQLTSAKGTSIINNSYLSQNIPNPSKGNIVIPFQIATGSKTAFLQVIETGSGKVLKTVPVNVNATQVTVNTGLFSAGIYSYSLVVDGKLVDTKQMVVAK